MNIEKRLSELEEQQTDEQINIPIFKWVESDRSEIEKLTGIKFEWSYESE